MMVRRLLNKLSIRLRVSKIRKLARQGLAGEIEAHELQDELARQALETIAERSKDLDARTIATEALRAYEVEFQKYYA